MLGIMRHQRMTTEGGVKLRVTSKHLQQRVLKALKKPTEEKELDIIAIDMVAVCDASAFPSTSARHHMFVGSNIIFSM